MTAEKFILDATASNRTIYETKNDPNVIYLDIEKKLSRAPTIFADNRQLPFLDQTAHTIIYDPPYYWNNGKPDFYGIPDSKTFKEIWHENRKFPRYYGTDKSKNRSQLIKSLYLALLEFQRVLTPNGLLWVKWSENALSLNRFLCLFNNFNLLLKIEVRDKLQTQGTSQTYWLCFTKKSTLEGFYFMKIPEEAKKQ